MKEMLFNGNYNLDNIYNHIVQMDQKFEKWSLSCPDFSIFEIKLASQENLKLQKETSAVYLLIEKVNLKPDLTTKWTLKPIRMSIAYT